MTPEEIRKSAPKGATHYNLIFGDIIYCKIVSSQLYGYADGIGWYKYYGNIPIKPLN